MKISAELKALEARIGYQFSRPQILVQAMTHPSMSSPSRPSNQRLEFLGDRVLNLLVAEALFHDDPTANEGKLAPRYNALVRKETCADVAREIDLGAAMNISRGEMLKGGRKSTSLLGDATESLIAALYLDGGLEAARVFVQKHWSERVKTAEAAALNPKSALQEWAARHGMSPPVYTEVSRSGPAHAMIFLVRASLSTGQSQEASAPSKRQAEKLAAEALLKEIKP